MRTDLARAALLCVALLGVAIALGGPAAADEGQALNVSFEEDSVAVFEGAQTVTLHVEGTTGNVSVRSANISTDLLASMVDGTPIDNESVRVSVPADGDLQVRFPAEFECRTGRYAFSVSDGATTASAAIEVTAPLDTDARFADARTTVSGGERAEIGVFLDRCAPENVSVAIGNQTTALQATVTVTDNASGEVHGAVQFDPANLTGPGAFTAENLTVANVSVARLPANGTLETGEYPLTLRAGYRELSVATLVVESGEGAEPDPPASETPDSSPSPTDTASTDPPTSTETDGTASVPGDSPGAGSPSPTSTNGVGFTVPAALLALALAVLVLSRRE